jgi:MazG family protein
VASTAQDVWRRWDTIKREERGEDTSALDGVPAAMPALAYAQALLGRAARTGFRWPSTDNILEKLTEEMLELAEAETPEDRQEEFGDLLINLVNFAFMSDLDAESALRQSASKFRSRFQAMEELARAEGRELSEMPLAEMEKLWNQAKGSDRGLGRR